MWKVVIFLGLLLFVTGCSSDCHTGCALVGEGINVAGVFSGKELVYAFAWPPGIPKTDTNDPSTTPAARGIHFCYGVRDGLWMDGKKVAIPANSKVFALREDGTVVPLTLSDAETAETIKAITPGNRDARLPDGPVRDKMLASFQSAEANVE